MKMTVAGVQRIAGVSKASQQPFEMCNVIGLVQIEQVSNPKIQVNGAGFKPMEIPLAVEALPDFMGLKYPIILDLNIEPRPRNGKVESVVIGLLPKAA